MLFLNFRLRSGLRRCQCVIVVMIVFISVKTLAQISNPAPLPPTAASIQKFIDYPVGSYSGSVPVDINLFNITTGDINVPVSLSYHGGGVLVSDEPGWVGLNFSLNAGGVLTQTIKGRDDFNFMYFGGTEMIDITVGPSGGSMGIYPWYAPVGYNGFETGAISLGKLSVQHSTRPTVNGVIVPNATPYEVTHVDWEPDMFSFSFPGSSGRFVGTQDKNFHQLDQQNVQIIEQYTTNGLWKVIDAGGHTYTYSRLENLLDGGVLSGRSWYLTKITSASGNREVNFEYENGPQSAKTHDDWNFTQTVTQACAECLLGLGTTSRLYSRTYTPVYLKKITSDDGSYALFQRRATQREDLYGEYALQYIRTYNSQGQLLKEFELVTDYTTSPNVAPNPLVSYPTQTERDYDHKRLVLRKVIERGGTTALTTQFLYDETPLPQKTSFARDHWGYFNGRANSTLLSGFRTTTITGGGGMAFFKVLGSDRSPSEQHAKAGTLVKVIYPTGGSTSFDYAVHRYRNVSPDYTTHLFDTRKQVAYPGTPFQSAPIATPIAYGTESETAYLEIVGDCQGCSTISSSYVDVTLGSQFKRFELSILENNYPNQTTETLSGTNYSLHFKMYLRDLFTAPNQYGSFQAAIVAPNTGTFNIRAILGFERQYFPPYKLGGGLRVAKKTDVDENGIARTMEMLYEENNLCQGKLFSQPIVFTKNIWGANGTGSVNVSSSSITTPAGSGGGNVGYDKVTVLYGPSGIYGKSDFSYHNEIDQWADYEGRPPSIMKVPYDLNGKLKTKVEYKYTAGSFQMVRSDSMFYEIGIKVLIPAIASDPATEVSMGNVNQMLHYYPIFSNWIQETKRSTTETFPTGSVYSVSKSIYKSVRDISGNIFQSYPNEEEFLPSLWPKHLSPISVLQNLSDGKTLVTKYTYPDDFTSPSTPVQQMLNMNIDDTPIIEQTLIDDQVVSANAKKFSYDAGSSKLRLSSVFKLETKLPLTDFTVGSTGTTFDSRLSEEMQAVAYDVKGNLLEMSSTNNMHVAFLYGYNESLPVAKIENATYAQVAALLGSTNMNTLKGAMPTDSQVRNIIQLARQGLPSAKVTAYTHSPGQGVTSVTDANNQTTYYVYDSLGRLRLIKDAAGNILQQTTYNYKVK